STPNRVTHLGRRTMRRLAVCREHPVNKPERLTSAVAAREFLVGGVRMKRPFRIRRLGHFGVNVANPEKSKDFYCRLLGFRVSDPIDFGPRLPEDKRAGVGTTVGYFSRHGTDHHSFVFFPKDAYAVLNPHSLKPSGTINQITWQVGSLQEVSDAFDWFTRRGKQIRRAGRVLLARPFKIARIGPVRLFAENMEEMVRFYRDDLGLTITEEVKYKGHRCVFLRANTEHHTMALYPLELREELRLRADTTLMSFGLQLGSYKQLRDAIMFLKSNGVTIKYLPPELFPGIDYCAFAIDADG